MSFDLFLFNVLITHYILCFKNAKVYKFFDLLYNICIFFDLGDVI